MHGRAEVALVDAPDSTRDSAEGGFPALDAHSAPCATGGGRTCCAWSTRKCVTRSRNATPRSTGRSAHTGCPTTGRGSTAITTTWRGWRWRTARLAGVQRRSALPKLTDQFVKAWVPEDGGGIPWRKQDQFFNAPSQRSRGNLSAPLPRPATAGPADGRLDRQHADRPGNTRAVGTFRYNCRGGC